MFTYRARDRLSGPLHGGVMFSSRSPVHNPPESRAELSSAPLGDPLLDGLNPPQREAVLATEGPVLILAGAGTGKTAALTARLAHIVRSRLAWPSEILCVTFTNKAAREMRERVSHLLGPAVETLPWLGTFHAIAAKMLRRHAELAGLQSNFTILDTDDQLRLLKQLIQAQGLDEKRWPARLLAGCIDRWKNKGLSPADLTRKDSEDYANGLGEKLYRLYQERLKALNACDFGDLLLHMFTILRNNREVLELYRQRFKYLMVDEYQDTNQVQYLWLRLLAQARKNICVVGDDDQAIYSWRGAEVANILRFEKDFPGTKVIRLEQNYRSAPNILAAAAGLIEANSQRLGKRLWTAVSGGEKVRVIAVQDGPEEARRVGDEAARLQREGASLASMTILVRAQFQTREFEDRFIATGLPYRIVGGFRFYERAEVRDALAYLRLIAQPADDLAFERIYNSPKRGLGGKTLEKLHRHARAHGVPLSLAAIAIADTDELPGRARGTLEALMRDFARWRELAGQIAPAELTRTLLDESGYGAALKAENAPESAGRLENLAELVRAMEEYPSLGDFLEHVSLVMDNDANDRADKLTIMTIHAAKGLEFDHLYLAGWEEGLFPSQKALDQGGLASLEEERRLAYVAITRARRRCTILHASARRIYGQWSPAIPSRFITELPDAHIEHDTSLVSGISQWRRQWSERDDPFAHVARDHAARTASHHAADRQRTAVGHEAPRHRQPVPSRPPASFAAKPRLDIAVGGRVFHEKFGSGIVIAQEGNKLEIVFDEAGPKRVIDSFVKRAE